VYLFVVLISASAGAHGWKIQLNVLDEGHCVLEELEEHVVAAFPKSRMMYHMSSTAESFSK
jgi:hypothetical protein